MQKGISKILDWWEHSPLTLILGAAIFVRLIAVIFSKGYGMHDDHFLVVEVSQSWLEGKDVLNWFSKTQEENESGRSFFYPGLHYFLFMGLEKIGMHDPQIKMYVVRFLHALLSLVSVWMAYKISEKISGRETAKQVGIVMALLWLMPAMGVRNLIEMVVMPMLLVASWWVLISEEHKYKWWLLFGAGLLVGMAFPIRYQVLFFTGGISIALMLQKKWKESILYTIGMFVTIGLISGWLEWKLWGYPFGKVIYYVKDNIENSGNYFTLPWYTYILQVLIIFTPPLSLFIFFGQFKVWKKYFLLFVPTFLFFAFHSYFPNKQERFIFTVLPFILMMGLAGWNEIKNTSAYWQNKKKFIRGSWIFFWTLNTIVLCLFIFSYSKKSRVEAMYYFHDKPDVTGLIMETRTIHKELYLPRFYMDHKWPSVIWMGQDRSYEHLQEDIANRPLQERPNYVLFLDEKNLDERVKTMQNIYPNLHHVYTAKPGLLDWIMYKMNPVNINQDIFVYKTDL
jgi:hypothetical protein